MRNCYSGLPGYVEYEVAVAAQTAAGTGPYYNVLNFTTPEDGKQSFLTVSTLFYNLPLNLKAHCMIMCHMHTLYSTVMHSVHPFNPLLY